MVRFLIHILTGKDAWLQSVKARNGLRFAKRIRISASVVEGSMSMYRSIFATTGLRAGRKSSIASAAPLTAALVVLTAFSGCKTLSWKPSGKMFAWGKKPADSVEGAEGLVLPTSPATKYSPQGMASLGTQSGAGASSPPVS